MLPPVRVRVGLGLGLGFGLGLWLALDGWSPMLIAGESIHDRSVDLSVKHQWAVASPNVAIHEGSVTMVPLPPNHPQTPTPTPQNTLLCFCPPGERSVRGFGRFDDLTAFVAHIALYDWPVSINPRRRWRQAPCVRAKVCGVLGEGPVHQVFRTPVTPAPIVVE